jgi:two-component system, OmpR family, alkaline phosphatase synthesis response regulator PhoP
MNTRSHILVIEDDQAIRRGLVDALTFDSFQVSQAANVKEGLQFALTIPCDLILLDLLLPGGSGLDILQKVRAARPTLPVIILTARGDEPDRVKGLAQGADDYVVKPFSIRELIARVRAVLRRSPGRPLDVTSIFFPGTGATADLSRREVIKSDGTRVELSKTEADLLRFLATQSGRAVSREEILRHVWMIEPQGLETRTIDMHIARLREKLADQAPECKTIVTVRGKGYTLFPDIQTTAPSSEQGGAK